MLGKRVTRGVTVGVAVVALGGGLAACGSSDNKSSGGGGGSSGKAVKIALLLPETKNARYETQDKPLFEKKVKELCSNCEVLYSNADQDPAKQQSQVEAAITKQVDVMVLDPVDSASASGMVAQAKSENIPVISYDRLVTDAEGLDYYTSFDNVKVGELQGKSLVDKLTADGKKGSIFMINGSPTDNNAKLFKQGAHSVIDKSPYKVAKEYDTPDWSPDKAQNEADQAITALGKNGFVGVYAANDGTAGGAIAAMQSGGVDPSKIPTTGQDAELTGVQRILIGEQYMTVYKAVKPEAGAAAELAIALGRGEKPKSGLVNSKTDNGKAQVPSAIFQPVAVTADNVNDTIVKDGYWTAAQICTPKYKAACDKAGIK
jgi:D-xylose transport system substrate-binding protein